MLCENLSPCGQMKREWRLDMVGEVIRYERFKRYAWHDNLFRRVCGFNIANVTSAFDATQASHEIQVEEISWKCRIDSADFPYPNLVLVILYVRSDF